MLLSLQQQRLKQRHIREKLSLRRGGRGDLTSYYVNKRKCL